MRPAIPNPAMRLENEAPNDPNAHRGTLWQTRVANEEAADTYIIGRVVDPNRIPANLKLDRLVQERARKSACAGAFHVALFPSD